MKTGLSYDDAYSITIKKIKVDRNNLNKTALQHPPVKIPLTLTRLHYSILTLCYDFITTIIWTTQSQKEIMNSEQGM